MKYRREVYENVQNYFLENINQEITKEQIDKLPRKDVFRYYLEWEGIYGYTGILLEILGTID